MSKERAAKIANSPGASKRGEEKVRVRRELQAGRHDGAEEGGGRKRQGGCPEARALRRRDRTEETAALARVAGRALLMDASHDHVRVAVDPKLLPVLHVATRVALAPRRASIATSRPCGLR